MGQEVDRASTEPWDTPVMTLCLSTVTEEGLDPAQSCDSDSIRSVFSDLPCQMLWRSNSARYVCFP